MGITWVREEFGREESLGCLEEYVRAWFEKTFEDLTPPQRFSFKLISEGENLILAAPTGSGKTLAGFMVILSELFKLGEHGKLEDGVYCIYVSPLKALDNDVHKNLLTPLKEIREIAASMGVDLPELRIALRTGDVPPSEKQKQLKEPPHILITTPESIAVLLNAPKFVQHLKKVRWVIVDEIHELASNKRGVHLSLSLERLVDIAGEFVRIGLGATLHPLEEAALFLVGLKDGKPRSCKVVDVSWVKPLDLKVLSPVDDLVHATAAECNEAMYRTLDELISKHRTTLVFTNTRSGTERVVYHLKERWGKKYHDGSIGAHHGSLSRDIRLDVENKLKNGKLRCVVCSTSLELGIDIGSVDLVVQIGSPKSVTRAVQRIGRSGHSIFDVAKGRVLVLDRDDLVECAVMLRCAKERRLDKIQIPQNCLDVLSQHLVGMALHRKWGVDEAFKLVKRSYCYHRLDKKAFLSTLRYLAGHYASLEDQRVYGKIWLDEEEGVFGRRGKYTRVIYYLNIGAIPDEVKIDVYRQKDRRHVGGIEEGFLERLRPGDIFVLGGKLYKFRFARGMRCYVEEAPKGAVPTIPAWFSEMLPLSYDLALEIQSFRALVKEKLDNGENPEKIRRWVEETLPVDGLAAQAIVNYFMEQYQYTDGLIPDRKTLLIEKTYDLLGRRYVVFHALFGRRANDALSRAVGVLLSDQIGHSVGVIVSDNGFTLHIPRDRNPRIDLLLEKLMESDLEALLRKNIRRTELMRRRFRHCAARSFMVLRNYKGHKISVSKQQMSAQSLLRVCEEVDSGFPVIQETYREI
ncbi:MAG: ATP-dependent helicase, partial [Methanobacteriota archaeon]